MMRDGTQTSIDALYHALCAANELRCLIADGRGDYKENVRRHALVCTVALDYSDELAAEILADLDSFA